MKIYHFALIFMIFFVSVIAVVDGNIEQISIVNENIRDIDLAVEKATVAAANKLLDFEMAGNLNKEGATETFFYALGTSLGIADSPSDMERLKMYVPVIAVTDKDGFYIRYMDLKTENGQKEIVPRWTGKIYYSYQDNRVNEGKRATNFVYKFIGECEAICCDVDGITGEVGKIFSVSPEFCQEDKDSYYFDDIILSKRMNYDTLLMDWDKFEDIRKSIVANKLEQYLSFYCNNHNSISEQWGINYSFSLPSYDTSFYLRYASGISFLAFFQGYPIVGTDKIYNRFCVSNTQIVEKNIYYVDDNGLYHFDKCEKSGRIIVSYYSKKECAETGAYPCDCCR